METITEEDQPPGQPQQQQQQRRQNDAVFQSGNCHGDGGGGGRRMEDELQDQESVRELFDICDQDGKGFVTVDDLKQVCIEIGLTVDQIGVVFGHLDKDGDGNLTCEEFQEGWELFVRQSKSTKYIRQKLDSPRSNKKNQFATVNQKKRSRCSSISEILGLLRNNETASEFWSFIQAEHPELIPYLEDFLRVLASEHQKIKDEAIILEKSFDKKSLSYQTQIKALYEEMETQVQTEKAEISLKEEKLERKLQQKLEEANQLMERKMEDLLEKWFLAEKQLKAANEPRKSTFHQNKMLYLEKEYLEKDLETYHRKIMELKLELELIREDISIAETQNQIQGSAKELSEKIALERKALDEQLSLLRSINKRLIDGNDELAASSVFKDLLDFKAIGTTVSDDSSRLNFKRGSIVANYCNRFSDQTVSTDCWTSTDCPSSMTSVTCLVCPNNHTSEINVQPSNLTRNQHKDPLTQNIYKVVFIGDSSVGKTSLIGKICNLPFRENIGSTIGVDFHNRSVICDDHEVILQLWDTAGQERFRSLTGQYLRRSDAVLVVYDVTSEISFRNVNSWISTLENVNDNNEVVVVVANKIDSDRRCLLLEDGQKLAKNTGAMYFETSAWEGHGITELVTALTSKLERNQKKKNEKTINLSGEKNFNETKRNTSCC